MTILEKKRFLSQYQTIARTARQLADEKIRWRNMINKLSACSDEKVVEERNEKFAKLEKEIDGELDRIFALRGAIDRAVNTVADPLQRLILRNRYLDNMSWVKIMVNAGMSERHVYRLHSQGIKNMRIE